MRRVATQKGAVRSKILRQERMPHALQASEGGSSNSERRSASASYINVPCTKKPGQLWISADSYSRRLIGQRACHVIRLENEWAKRHYQQVVQGLLIFRL